MDKKVLLWNGPTLVKVEREEVNQFLHEEVQKYGQKTYLFRKIKLKDARCNFFGFLIEHLDDISCIQIYQDNVVRLHKIHGHYEDPTSIFIVPEDSEEENDEFAEFLEEIKAYAKSKVYQK